MKLNNETKIGILAVVGISIFIAGFNFLKGKNLFKKEKENCYPSPERSSHKRIF